MIVALLGWIADVSAVMALCATGTGGLSCDCVPPHPANNRMATPMPKAWRPKRKLSIVCSFRPVSGSKANVQQGARIPGDQDYGSVNGRNRHDGNNAAVIYFTTNTVMRTDANHASMRAMK